MTLLPKFPSKLHQRAAESVRDYFVKYSGVDTVLIVNSCARGHAVPESDLDIAILVRQNTTRSEIRRLETQWLTFSATNAIFAHLHLDIIDGNYSRQN